MQLCLLYQVAVAQYHTMCNIRPQFPPTRIGFIYPVYNPNEIQNHHFQGYNRAKALETVRRCISLRLFPLSVNQLRSRPVRSDTACF